MSTISNHLCQLFLLAVRGVHGLGLGSTWNRPNSVGLKDSGPAADHEKLRVESDWARVDIGWTRLDQKTENKDEIWYKFHKS